MADTITIKCISCNCIETGAQRWDYDPPQAAIRETMCQKCFTGKYSLIRWIDRDGKEMRNLTGTVLRGDYA